VVNEHLRNGQGINCLSVGMPMCSLCDVVNKCGNAVVASFLGRQVGYKFDADSWPSGFGDRMWLQKAHGFAALVIGSMA
jgi:hypothetical protein